jgi:hypothetical protein
MDVSLLVVLGVVVTAGLYFAKSMLSCGDRDDDIEIDGEQRTRIRHEGGL